MKAQTAKLLRTVVRLIEDDVRELADAVVEIDERSARHSAQLQELDRKVLYLTERNNHSRRV